MSGVSTEPGPDRCCQDALLRKPINESSESTGTGFERCRGWRRWLLVVAGLLCVGLGLLGVFLPVLPTTPFLLLAAACFIRSSDRLYQWLLQNRLFGEKLRCYRAGEGIPLATRITAIVMIWLTLLSTILFVLPDDLWWLRVLLCLIGAAVTIHIARQRPGRKVACGRPAESPDAAA